MTGHGTPTAFQDMYVFRVDTGICRRCLDCDRCCSRIPGLNVQALRECPCRFHGSPAVGRCTLRMMGLGDVDGSMSKAHCRQQASQSIGRSRHRQRPGRDVRLPRGAGTSGVCFTQLPPLLTNGSRCSLSLAPIVRVLLGPDASRGSPTHRPVYTVADTEVVTADLIPAMPSRLHFQILCCN